MNDEWAKALSDLQSCAKRAYKAGMMDHINGGRDISTADEYSRSVITSKVSEAISDLLKESLMFKD